jgi:hypothetical protein
VRCGKAVDRAKRIVRGATAMKKRDVKPMEWRPIHRFGFSLMGLMFIAMGTFTLLRRKTHYENYWGAQFSLLSRFSSGFCSSLAYLRTGEKGINFSREKI